MIRLVLRKPILKTLAYCQRKIFDKYLAINQKCKVMLEPFIICTVTIIDRLRRGDISLDLYFNLHAAGAIHFFVLSQYQTKIGIFSA